MSFFGKFINNNQAEQDNTQTSKVDENSKTPELKLIKSGDSKETGKMKDNPSTQHKENVYVVRIDKNVNFEELYQKANIESSNDSIEIVINTTKKLSSLLENSPLNVLQITVQATLETAGRDIEKIKQDGNNKITAIKKYKEAVENELNKSINETKNKIIELEKQIEQHKLDIQNKKNIGMELNKKIDSKIQEISGAIRFLNRESEIEFVVKEEEK